MEQAEDGRRRPDSQSQRQDRDNREGWGLQETPNGIANVARNGLEKREPALIAMSFSDLLHATEVATSGRSRVRQR